VGRAKPTLSSFQRHSVKTQMWRSNITNLKTNSHPNNSSSRQNGLYETNSN